LIFLGSSCIYPKFAKQPIKEDYLLTGKLEPTNEPYAIAKIAGIKMCESYNLQYKTKFISLMPCNLYGINDNYDKNNSHFLPALIRKVYEAKKRGSQYIEVWGDGKPLRELLYVDDLADACLYFLKKKINHSLINIGSGEDKSIAEYLKEIMRQFNVSLKIKYNKKMPNGTPRKLLDVSLAKSYGWQKSTDLNSGLNYTIKDFIKKYEAN